MKKYFYLFATAAVALASCSSDDTIAENSSFGNQQQKEIAFSAFTSPQTRAAVHGTGMPDQTLYVAAYQAAATSPATVGNYFAKTSFKKNYQGGASGATDNVWGGDPARYYPLSPATLNFLAVTGKESATDIGSHVDFNATNYAQDVTVAYTSANSYSKTSQVDIMYGVGQGIVSQTGNNLGFAGAGTTSAENVAMTFNHALALLNFQVKAATGQAGLIQVNSITVNGASYNGTLAVKNANYAATDASAKTQPKIMWTPAAAEANAVTGISNYTLTTEFYPTNADNDAANWANLMIIPSDTYDATDNSTDDPIQRGFNSFTINYTVKAQTGFAAQTYEYTYWPSGTVDTPTNVQEGKIYTYKITLTLHEIRIEPVVTDWTDGTGSPSNVNI